MTSPNGSPDNEVHALAEHFGVKHFELIAKGTEAHVYSLDSARVLKIYSASNVLSGIEALHDFYERASTVKVSFAIPHIHEHGQAGSIVYSVEDRLVGTPMAEIPDFLVNTRLADIYIDAVLEIKRISVSPPYMRRKLFGANNFAGDWNKYIHNEITTKYRALRDSLPAAVVAKLGPIHVLTEFFAAPYSDADLLIHGDYHPGNILVVDSTQVSAVVDFGVFTMFGDPLYDVAAACGFFSMYEPDQLVTRKAILERLFQRDGTLDQARIYAYLLCVALLTCDLYPDDGIPIYETGHFGWALSVLGDAQMWEAITT